VEIYEHFTKASAAISARLASEATGTASVAKLAAPGTAGIASDLAIPIKQPTEIISY